MVEKSLSVSFVQYVLQQICGNTADLEIKTTDDDRGTLISISVAEEDMGKIIGKKGQTISALRTMISVISAREGKRYFLKVEDPELS